eukprot:TRINITY_DN3043_c0_g1_i1.p1 TRINITY_DN3043_c0_g1~~TRINITY_DN3043_c0_g1_i1.p1  ORF type:complete len:336 (+),score=56.23 TRINITY_DN3043_c0_g1_i1:397-1404(+)
MALPLANKRPHPAYHVHPLHRAAFAAVLKQIPLAVEAMRREAVRRHSLPPSVFILDWDDTCCATSFLERCGFMADLDFKIDERAPELASHLRVLESRVLSLLKTAISLGTVLIVTNAGDGWVELSSSRFLPAVRAFLENNYKLVKIISARARYVDVYRDHPLQWKARTFLDELRSICATLPHPSQPLHVLVLGDSVGDQYAAHAAANHLTMHGAAIVLKVVKFLERPTIDQLCRELSVLLDHISDMAAHRDAFDISMYKESSASHQNHNCNQTHDQQHPNHSQTTQSQHHVQQNSTASASHDSTPMLVKQPSSSPSDAHAPLSPVSAMATCAAVV